MMHLLMAWLCLGFVVSGTDAAVDRAKMQRDVRIMEGVLSELLSGNDVFEDHADVSGMYFDGYGVLFLVERPRVIVRVRHGNRTVSRTESGDEETTKLKEHIEAFYGDYAKNLGLLSDDERVTVRVQGGRGSGSDYSSFGGMSEMDLEKMLETKMRFLEIEMESVEDEMEAVEVEMEVVEEEMEAVEEEMEALEEEIEEEGDESVAIKRYGFDPAQIQKQIEEATRRIRKAVVKISPHGGSDFPTLEATATKAEIDRGQEGFVKFKEYEVGETSEKSIRIMAGILNSALEGGSYGRSHGHASGFYQEGLGAVLFLDTSPGQRGFYGHAIDYYKSATGDTTPNETEEVGKFTKELVSLIGEYGGTLKSVKADESVAVRADFGHWGRLKGRPSGLLVQIKMQDVERFGKGRLDLDGLMEAAIVEEL